MEWTFFKNITDCWTEGRRHLKRLLKISLNNFKKLQISEEVYWKQLLKERDKYFLCLAGLYTAWESVSWPATTQFLFRSIKSEPFCLLWVSLQYFFPHLCQGFPSWLFLIFMFSGRNSVCILHLLFWGKVCYTFHPHWLNQRLTFCKEHKFWSSLLGNFLPPSCFFASLVPNILNKQVLTICK